MGKFAVLQLLQPVLSVLRHDTIPCLLAELEKLCGRVGGLDVLTAVDQDAGHVEARSLGVQSGGLDRGATGGAA